MGATRRVSLCLTLSLCLPLSSDDASAHLYSQCTWRPVCGTPLPAFVVDRSSAVTEWKWCNRGGFLERTRSMVVTVRRHLCIGRVRLSIERPFPLQCSPSFVCSDENYVLRTTICPRWRFRPLHSVPQYSKNQAMDETPSLSTERTHRAQPSAAAEGTHRTETSTSHLSLD